MKPILLNDFQRVWESHSEELINSFSKVGSSGWYILGKEVGNFELNLANFCGSKFAIGCASGLDAIEIALRACELQPGDKVLTTPLSAFATTLAIVRAGGVPVFCDVDENGLIDLNQAHKILSTSKDIKFFLPVHLYGHSLDMKRLSKIVEDTKVTLIEDCAQSIGSSFDGIASGSVGKASILSFYPTKNLGGMGDGGAVLTNCPHISKQCYAIRDYGQSSKYKHDIIGMNSRLDELQACLLNDVFLKKLPEWTDKRMQIASYYISNINNPLISILAPKEVGNSARHLFPISVDEKRREEFISYLKSNHIHSAIHYPITIPKQEALKQIKFDLPVHLLPNAERIASTEVSLPIHPYLTHDEISMVVKTVNSWR